MNSDKIKDAAEKYASEKFYSGDRWAKWFEEFALSDAVKEYWFAQFELEKLKKETLAMCDLALELNSKIGTELQFQQKQSDDMLKRKLIEWTEFLGEMGWYMVEGGKWEHDDETSYFSTTADLVSHYNEFDETPQKQLSDEEIEKLAEKETYVDVATNLELRIMKDAFIKGLKYKI